MRGCGGGKGGKGGGGGRGGKGATAHQEGGRQWDGTQGQWDGIPSVSGARDHGDGQRPPASHRVIRQQLFNAITPGKPPRIESPPVAAFASMHSSSALYLGFNFCSSVLIIFVNKSLFSGGLRFEFTCTLTVLHYVVNLLGLELLRLCGAYEARACAMHSMHCRAYAVPAPCSSSKHACT